jgi:hypothetical protein
MKFKTPNFWNKVLFSDESKLFCNKSGLNFVRKFDDESWDNKQF